MKLPVVSITVSLNEIPDHIAVAIELGNCKQKCKGCHSPWNGRTLNYKCWTELEDILYQVNSQVKKGADAIVLMGGTNNAVPVENLIEAINILSCYAPVGIYSGLEDRAEIHKILKNETNLIWLKTGSYAAKYGGLTSPNTNQRFYERQSDNKWLDKTYLFHQRKDNKIEED